MGPGAPDLHISSPESVFIGIVNLGLVRSGFVHLLQGVCSSSSKALGKEGTGFLNPDAMWFVGHGCVLLHLQVLVGNHQKKTGVAWAGMLGFGEGKEPE